jgi:hypothetical protein
VVQRVHCQRSHRQRSETSRLGQVDTEAIAAALVAAGHFGAGVTELFLHVALVDLGAGSESGPQRMSGEFSPSFSFAQIASHAGCKRRSLDQPGDVLVGKPFDVNRLAVVRIHLIVRITPFAQRTDMIFEKFWQAISRLDI